MMKRKITLCLLLVSMVLWCGIAAAGDADVETLSITGADTDGLAFLSAYKNLKTLTLTDCPAYDLTPLVSCSRLTSLTIEWTDGYTGNGTFDLSPLQSCTRLNTLSLIGAGIDDLSVLPEIAKLATLTVQSVSAADYSPMEKLSLKHLRVYGADADAVTAIFTAIGRKLESASVGGCTLTDEANDAILSSTRLISLNFDTAQSIDGNSAKWAKLSNLTSLAIDGGSVGSLAFCDSYVATVAVKLTNVFLDGSICSVDFDKYFLKTSAVPEAGLLELLRGGGRRWQYVTVENETQPLSSDVIAALSQISSIVSMDLQNFAADAFSPDVWDGFSKLEQLKIADSADVPLQMLYEIPKLLRLSIQNAAIEGAESLETLTKLQQLSLVKCTVDDWAFLDRLGSSQLALLNLSGCDGPVSLAFVKDLDQLKVLALENAPVTDLEPLAGRALTDLYLYGCDIADFTPLTTLTMLERISCNETAALPALACRVLRKPVIAQE